MVGASTTPLLPPLLPSAKKSPKRRFRPVGIRAPNVTAPAPKKHRPLLDSSTKYTSCESLNNEAANLNEEDDMEGGKYDVDEGEDINVGSDCVNRDDQKQDQKVIPKLMNVDQHPIQQYRKVSDATVNQSVVNTNDVEEANGNEIVSKSNASIPVKLVATSADAIHNNRKERDAPLIDDSMVPTVMYTPKPNKEATSKRPVDATPKPIKRVTGKRPANAIPNDTRNAETLVSIRAPNVTAPAPKKDQPLLEFSTKSSDDTTCNYLNNKVANLNEGNDIDGGKNVDEDEDIKWGKDIRDVEKQEQKIIPRLINVVQRPAQQYRNKKHRPLHEFSTKPSNKIHKEDKNLTKLSRKIFDKNSNIREVMRELHLLLKDGKPEKLDGAEIGSNKSTPVIASNTSTPIKLVAALSDAIHNNNDERDEPLIHESPTNMSLLTFSSSSSPLCNIMVPVTCTPKPSKKTTTSKGPADAIPNDTRNAEAPVSIRAPYVAGPAPKKHQSFEFSTNSSDDTTCKSLNNEAANLNEGNELDGAINDVFDGEEINVGSKYVDRDVGVHRQEQNNIPRLINVVQRPTQHYHIVSDVTDNELDVNTNNIEEANGAEIASTASTPVKLVAASSDAIRDNRMESDAPLMHGSCLWTLSSSYPFCWVPITCTPQPSKHTTCHMDDDAESNDPSNTSLSSSTIYANSFANRGAHHGPTFESASLFSFDDALLYCELVDTSITTPTKSLHREVPSEIGIRSQLTQEANTNNLDRSSMSNTSSNPALNENDPLLMFLRSQHTCIKGNIEEFYTWLVNEDIDCMSALKEAVSDDEYLDDSMKKGCGASGIKGFKRKVFQRAVLEYKEVNYERQPSPSC